MNVGGLRGEGREKGFVSFHSAIGRELREFSGEKQKRKGRKNVSEGKR